MAEEIPAEVKRQIANGKTLQQVFSTDDGRKVLFYLMKEAGILEAVHSEVPGENDYNNGKRAVVLKLLQDLRYDWGKLYDLSLAGSEPEAYNINP